ncbi:MAG TPA: hypothetical protein VKF35_10515 [Hyphomicrobiaceae bacterium]|nr:hypothetical protein [Hyphomicrobiaceae bacterium]
MLRTGHPTRHRQPGTVGGQSYRKNLPFSPRSDLATDDALRFAGGNIPDPDNFVIARRNNLLAVRREQQVPHQIAMTTRLDRDDEAAFAQIFARAARRRRLRHWFGLRR